jgi:hypothetical protein
MVLKITRFEFTASRMLAFRHGAVHVRKAKVDIDVEFYFSNRQRKTLISCLRLLALSLLSYLATGFDTQHRCSRDR